MATNKTPAPPPPAADRAKNFLLYGFAIEIAKPESRKFLARSAVRAGGAGGVLVAI